MVDIQAETFGFKFYGILCGLVFAVAAAVSFLQVPLNQWAQGTCGDDSVPHTHTTTATTSSYSHIHAYKINGPNDNNNNIFNGTYPIIYSDDGMNNSTNSTGGAEEEDSCYANWPLWHIIQLFMITSTMYFAYWDYGERKRKEEEKVLRQLQEKQGNQALQYHRRYVQQQQREGHHPHEEGREEKGHLPTTGYGSIQG